MNTKNSEDETAMILAVESQATEIVKSLLQREKLEMNSKNSSGWTALMLAVKGNYTDIVHELLRSKNINVNVKTTEGKTALQIAYETGHTDVVKSFLRQDHHFEIDITGEDRFVVMLLLIVAWIMKKVYCKGKCAYMLYQYMPFDNYYC